MPGGWGCPHEIDNHCGKLNNQPCNPGMKGCVLAGRFRFANEDKNTRFYEKRSREQQHEPTVSANADKDKDKDKEPE